MFNLRTRFGLLAIAIAGLLVQAMPPNSTLAGRPAPPPPLPPMRYQIQFWDMPIAGAGAQINSMNNHGQVVGWYVTADGRTHGFLYDPAISPSLAIDLNDLVEPPAGWEISSCTDINDNGVLVGSIEDLGSTSARHGFVVDLTAPALVMQLLPDDAWHYTVPLKINEDGDILGAFRDSNGTFGAYIYDPASDAVPVDLGVVHIPDYAGLNNRDSSGFSQAVLQLRDSGYGRPVRWTRSATGGVFEAIPKSQLTFGYAINDSGTVCGSSTKSLKGSSVQYPFRYTTSMELLTSMSGHAIDINSGGDLLVSSATPHLYKDGWGFLPIANLLDNNDPDTPVLLSFSFNVSCMNNRLTGPEFGQLVGITSSSQPFFLTPVSTP